VAENSEQYDELNEDSAGFMEDSLEQDDLSALDDGDELEDVESLEDEPDEPEIERVTEGEEGGDGIEAEDFEPAAATEGADEDTFLYSLRLPYTREPYFGFYGSELKSGDTVVAATQYGNDVATVVKRLDKPRTCRLRACRILRQADAADIARAESWKEMEDDAFKKCRELIFEHKLNMKLVLTHHILEEQKLLFFYTAERRVDFRALVKELVAEFRTRVEMWQINSRLDPRMTGGIGVCGRECCCCRSISNRPAPISIKMAKEQDISLNSMKISGLCGKLLCCLAFEQEFYHEQRQTMPSQGNKVNVQGEIWKVTSTNAIKGTVSITAEDGRSITLPAANFTRQENPATSRNLWSLDKSEEADRALTGAVRTR
jgi:cell fate regulator YaaT (PSP1 superfamily)